MSALHSAIDFYLEGNRKLAQNNMNEAISHFEIAVKMEHRKIEYRLALAEAYIKVDKLDEAEKMLKAVKELEKYDPKAFKPSMYSHAALKIAKGNIQAGILELRNFISLLPNSTDVTLHSKTHYLLGRALEKLGGIHNLSLAFNAYREVLRKNPEHALANFRMGEIAFKQNNFSTAICYLQNALELKKPKLDSEQLFDAETSLKYAEKALADQEQEKSLRADLELIKKLELAETKKLQDAENQKKLEEFNLGLSKYNEREFTEAFTHFINHSRNDPSDKVCKNYIICSVIGMQALEAFLKDRDLWKDKSKLQGRFTAILENNSYCPEDKWNYIQKAVNEELKTRRFLTSKSPLTEAQQEIFSLIKNEKMVELVKKSDFYGKKSPDIELRQLNSKA